MNQQIIAVGVFLGIILGLSIDLAERTIGQPIVYVAEAKEIEPKEVLIEARINWTEERIKEEIRKTFPEAPDIAVALAKAESSLKTTAYNPEAHKGCFGSIGIMQIACVHNRSNPDALHDVKLNLKKARAIYDSSLKENGDGWLPWGAYTDGSYKKYL